MLTLKKPHADDIEDTDQVDSTISMVHSYNELEMNSDKNLVVNTVEELEVDTFEESLHEEIENEVQTRQHIDITSIIKELNCCHFVLFILYLYLAAK